MQLTRDQEAELRAAIVAAFPGFNGVAQLSAALLTADIDIAYAGGMHAGVEAAVHDVVIQANAGGRIEDVVGAVRRAKPGNAPLARLERAWLRTVGADEPERLEAMVLEDLNYAEAGGWSARLQHSYRRVCRVERAADGHSMGTGFLVADDLVLTNYHVLFGVLAPGSGQPTPVQLRFDAIGAAQGRLAAVAAGDWLVAGSKPGGAEWRRPGGGAPTPEELDFALIRLAEPVGRDGEPAAPRGHVRIESIATAGQAQRPVVVLQHPLGASLQICLGSFAEPNANGTRLRHTATTQQGSSGSPCLSMELNAVGLHNGGGNSAIPLALIAAAVNRNGTIMPVQGP